MNIRIFLALLFLVLIPVFKGTAQSIEVEGFGGVAWHGKQYGTFIEKLKYPDAYVYVGSGFNYQILKHSFLTSGLTYCQTRRDAAEQFKTWSIPIQWSQRYGKKVQVQLGMGTYIAVVRDIIDGTYYHYVQGGDPLIGEYKIKHTKFDFGIAGSVAVYVPLNNVLALKAGLNRNWGLKNAATDLDSVNAPKERTTAAFLGLSIKLKKK